MISKIASPLFLLFSTALMGTVYVLTLGSSLQEVYLSIATLCFIALSLALERLFPLHSDWNHSRGDTLGDIGSFVFVFALIDGALKWLTPFIILAMLTNVSEVSSFPLWAEIVVATLLIELGAWISHWGHHRFRPLWALHAMHHSAERLYTLNNFRFHPLNHILNYLVMYVPLLALGISTEALLGYSALTLPVLLFQHSNICFKFGVLSYFFNTNTLHRWHHSASYQEGMHNFGRALVIWDHVFGTFYNPAGNTEPSTIGLASGGSSYPQANRTLKQIIWPFTKECCQ